MNREQVIEWLKQNGFPQPPFSKIMTQDDVIMLLLNFQRTLSDTLGWSPSQP